MDATSQNGLPTLLSLLLHVEVGRYDIKYNIVTVLKSGKVGHAQLQSSIKLGSASLV